jgi:CDP-paratose 2-epimerase
MRKQNIRSVLIFGGAGFIGSNLAHSLLAHTDAKVHIFDNLSRAGVHHNLEWLRKMAGNSGRLQMTVGDIRDARQVEKAVAHASEIYHFAAQVAG